MLPVVVGLVAVLEPAQQEVALLGVPLKHVVQQGTGHGKHPPSRGGEHRVFRHQYLDPVDLAQPGLMPGQRASVLDHLGFLYAVDGRVYRRNRLPSGHNVAQPHHAEVQAGVPLGEPLPSAPGHAAVILVFHRSEQHAIGYGWHGSLSGRVYHRFKAHRCGQIWG